ncbi:MAG: metal-dependent hydrolase [Ktedonobacteraceae bacterium]
MEGKTHVGFALAGAITLNNGMYLLFPHPLPGIFDSIFHAIGTPWTFRGLAHLWQTQQVFMPAVVEVMGYKLTFFVFLVWCARLPDRLERRKRKGAEAGTLSNVATLPVKHRGFTHSCFLLFLFISLVAGTATFLEIYFQRHPVELSPVIRVFLGKELFAVFLGIFLAFVLHIIADSLTTQGVKVLWPDETYYGSLPRSFRFNNDSWPEYIILWLMIFLVGGLIFAGIFGF